MVLSTRQKLKLFLLTSLMAYPLLTAAMCGQLLDKANINVTIDRSVEFDLDIDDYVKDSKDMKKASNGKLPKGSPDVKIPIDLDPQEFNIKNDPNIVKYGSKLRYANVQEVVVTVVSNSTNVDIPRVDVMMSEYKKNNFTVVGYLSGIPAGRSGMSENLVKSASAGQRIGQLFLKYQFEYKCKTALIVKGGQSVPKGKIHLKIKFKIKLSINPFK